MKIVEKWFFFSN